MTMSRGECYLNESINSEDSEIRLAFGVVDEIQVNKLLELKILRLHAIEYISEKR